MGNEWAWISNTLSITGSILKMMMNPGQSFSFVPTIKPLPSFKETTCENYTFDSYLALSSAFTGSPFYLSLSLVLCYP